MKKVYVKPPQSHPGFSVIQNEIESQGFSKKSAGAILASRTRNASSEAKKRNPNFKKVRG